MLLNCLFFLNIYVLESTVTLSILTIAASTTNITKAEELSDLSNQKDSKIADPAVT